MPAVWKHGTKQSVGCLQKEAIGPSNLSVFTNSTSEKPSYSTFSLTEDEVLLQPRLDRIWIGIAVISQ